MHRCFSDTIVLNAISNVYKHREQILQIGSIKANIGHCFAASGMASLAKCLKILDVKTLPPQLNSDLANDTLEAKWLVKIAKEKSDFSSNGKTAEPFYVAMNNFGICVTNGLVIRLACSNFDSLTFSIYDSHGGA